jgi:(p)ppGpp synthase/HD superfamily hydrolase
VLKNRSVFEAIEFAVREHYEQYRKGTRMPYVMHAIGAGEVLIRLLCEFCGQVAEVFGR